MIECFSVCVCARALVRVYIYSEQSVEVEKGKEIRVAVNCQVVLRPRGASNC